MRLFSIVIVVDDLRGVLNSEIRFCQWLFSSIPKGSCDRTEVRMDFLTRC
jgi:hypothetical protein